MALRPRKKSSAGENEAKSATEAKSAGSGGKKSAFSGKFNPKLKRTNPTTTADHTLVPHQWWARTVMVAGMLAVAVYTASQQQQTKQVIMAKRDETLSPKRYQALLCAPSFKQEIERVSGGSRACVPGKCGRVVFDGVVSEQEAHAMLGLAKKGLASGGGSGGASILDLHSGALSKGEGFVDFYKTHPDLFTARDFSAYAHVRQKVQAAIEAHFGVHGLHLTHPTFFSRITDRPAKTVHDEYWHVHVDKETYPNFHYTSLLYLTDQGEDFEGGSFVFVDTHDKLNRTIEPRLGRVSAFTSGIENKHHVQPVTAGTRYALTMGFTCDKTKAISDPGQKGSTNEQ